jgi:hypothetical protein
MSYKLGAIKYYPACMRLMAAHKDKYNLKELFSKPGNIELRDGNTIKFYFPLE